MTPFAVVVRWSGAAPSAPEVAPALGPVAGRASDGTRVVSVPGAAAALGLRVVCAGDALDDAVLVDRERRQLAVGDVRLYDRKVVEARLGDEARTDLTDLALLVLAYERLGAEGVASLVGDFAAVVWDWGARRLWAVRDHFGVRPLHYRAIPGGIALASDPLQLMALYPSDRAADPEMALDYLLGSFAHHGRSFFRRVRQVRPAHHLLASDAAISERGYWRPPAEMAEPMSYPEIVEEWRRLFRASVRARLQSRYPIVAHLSGGLDSGSVVGAAHEVYASGEAGRAPLTTVSAVFPGFDCDESPYIDAVLRRLPLFDAARWDGTALNAMDLERPTLAIPGLRRGPGGGPRGDMELAVARGARVLLSGIGGDDLGWARGVFRDVVSGRHVLTLLREVRAGSTSGVRNFVKDGIKRGLVPPALLVAVRDPWPGRGLPRPWLGPGLAAIFPGAPDDRAVDPNAFVSHLQREVWRALTGPQAAACVDMAVRIGDEAGVETRFPYLDVPLANFVLLIPWRQRLPHGDMRRLQRDGVAAFLPEVVVGRLQKPTFSLVTVRQIQARLPHVRRMFDDGVWASGAFLDRAGAQRLLTDLTARGNSGMQEWRPWVELWQLASFEAWLRAIFAYDPRQGTSMSHSPDDSEGGSPADAGSPARLAYERPTLTPIGSARDLLAGSTGSQMDAEAPPDFAPEP